MSKICTYDKTVKCNAKYENTCEICLRNPNINNKEE